MMKHYRIKFKGVDEVIVIMVAPGHDVGGELNKWPEPEFSIDNIQECIEVEQSEVEKMLENEAEEDRQIAAKKFKAKRTVDVKKERQEIEASEKAIEEANKAQAEKEKKDKAAELKKLEEAITAERIKSENYWKRRKRKKAEAEERIREKAGKQTKEADIVEEFIGITD